MFDVLIILSRKCRPRLHCACCEDCQRSWRRQVWSSVGISTRPLTSLSMSFWRTGPWVLNQLNLSTNDLTRCAAIEFVVSLCSKRGGSICHRIVAEATTAGVLPSFGRHGWLLDSRKRDSFFLFFFDLPLGMNLRNRTINGLMRSPQTWKASQKAFVSDLGMIRKETALWKGNVAAQKTSFAFLGERKGQRNLSFLHVLSWHCFLFPKPGFPLGPWMKTEFTRVLSSFDQRADQINRTMCHDFLFLTESWKTRVEYAVKPARRFPPWPRSGERLQHRDGETL